MALSSKRVARNPRRSLRRLLVFWFLIISIAPVAFITGIALVNFENAIENELIQRLRANARELNTMLGDYQKYLEMRLQRHEGDTALITHLSMNNIAQVRSALRPSVRNSSITSLSVFNREGRLVVSLTQDEDADAKESQTLGEQNLFLAENFRQTLDEKRRLAVVNPGAGDSVDLVVMTRLNTSTGRRAGYLEEIINIGTSGLETFKKRLNLELVLFDSQRNVVSGSHPDFLVYKANNKAFFAPTLEPDREVVFPLNIRDEPFTFIVSPVKWGEGTFFIGLGASQQKTRQAIRNVSAAFFTVAGAIVLLAVILAFFGARAVLRPLNDLLFAIQAMEMRDEVVEIPVTSDNELGVLTESFNDMSHRVRQARADLEKKIKELERANADLKDAQSKLVHSAKMVSLGQLVAGVAHELNNPIGFVYSNMSHLRDYSNRLLRIIEAGEKSPDEASRLKAEADFDYIVKDLPRLIQSCEDGARRVRDIVVGLRNFSRLEEAKIKRVDLAEGVQQTLRLLAGELKTRVKVHTEFGPLPQVLCYASQLNQVFMNILSNAAQAIEGEGEIFVVAEHLPADGGGGHVRVSIRDTGKGMPSDIQDKIFDPFFTTKTVGQGTGLGLSISYGIVKKHAGDIQVKSSPGEGTEFVITLPVDGPPGADKEAAPQV